MRVYCLFFFLYVLPVVVAAPINEWNMEIYLHPDMTADVNITFKYNETVDKSDYFLTIGAYRVKTYINGEEVKCVKFRKPLGLLIICENISAREVTYSFSTTDLITSTNSFSIFRYEVPLINPTELFKVKVFLPFGSVLIDKTKLEGTGLFPFLPIDGESGSDGRNIFITWEYEKPRLGSIFDFSVIYEPSVSMNPVWIIFPAVIVIIVLVFLVLYPRKKATNVLTVLDNNEKKVMEILFKEKEIDQRMLVKELRVSKSKISRIVKSLENRGLVKRSIKGRTKLIKLAKKG